MSRAGAGKLDRTARTDRGSGDVTNSAGRKDRHEEYEEYLHAPPFTPFSLKSFSSFPLLAGYGHTYGESGTICPFFSLVQDTSVQRRDTMTKKALGSPILKSPERLVRCTGERERRDAPD